MTSFDAAWEQAHNRTVLSVGDARTLWREAARLADMPGDRAELGCYAGGSAFLIASTGPEHVLHLFDTFCGLPDPGPRDAGAINAAGEFAASAEDVRQFLSGFPNVQLHVGLFSATAPAVERRHFAFVHLDCDRYEGIRAGIEVFWPRVKPGGTMMIHDLYWPGCPGVAPAVRDCLGDCIIADRAGLYGILRKRS